MDFIKNIQPAVASVLAFHPSNGFTITSFESVYEILKKDPVDQDAALFADLGCEMIPMVREIIQLASDVITGHLKDDVPRDVFTRRGVNAMTEGWIQKVFFTFNIAHDAENFKLVKEGIKEGDVVGRVAALREMTTVGYKKAIADLKTLL